MRRLFPLLAAVLLLAGCKKSNEAGVVEIRIMNNTAWTIYHPVINPSSLFGSESSSAIGHKYADIAAGASSDYKPYRSAYRYAEYSMEINGKRYAAVPYDYVGERLLAPGRYTYKISIDASADTLILTCTADQ